MAIDRYMDITLYHLPRNNAVVCVCRMKLDINRLVFCDVGRRVQPGVSVPTYVNTAYNMSQLVATQVAGNVYVGVFVVPDTINIYEQVKVRFRNHFDHPKLPAELRTTIYRYECFVKHFLEHERMYGFPPNSLVFKWREQVLNPFHALALVLIETGDCIDVFMASQLEKRK